MMVDGRYAQHTTTLYGQFQKAIDWTYEDMVEQYGELVLETLRSFRFV